MPCSWRCIYLTFHHIPFIFSNSLISSDTESPKYGQHYSAEEVIDIFKPADDAVATVRSWLESAGIAAERIGHSANKQWIQFDATVEEAEDLLKTKYHSYEHLGTENWNIGCDQ